MLTNPKRVAADIARLQKREEFKVQEVDEKRFDVGFEKDGNGYLLRFYVPEKYPFMQPRVDIDPVPENPAEPEFFSPLGIIVFDQDTYHCPALTFEQIVDFIRSAI